jgi:hypothetical protein
LVKANKDFRIERDKYIHSGSKFNKAIFPALFNGITGFNIPTNPSGEGAGNLPL